VFDERSERARSEERVAGAAEYARVGDAALDDSPNEGGLPDSCLAGDEHDAAAPFSCIRERLLERDEHLVMFEEPASCARLRAGHRIIVSRVRPPFKPR
jgi:hypothetical protein